MDRRRAESPVYGRQRSVTESRSPSMSPAHRMHVGGIGDLSPVNRTKNVATKAAARRLAKVMASQNKDNEENDDGDHGLRFEASTLNSGIYDSSVLPYISTNSSNRTSNSPVASIARHNRSQSPALVRKSAQQIPSVRSASAGRPAMSVRSAPTTPNLKLPTLLLKPPVSIPPLDLSIKDRVKRFFGDVPSLNLREKGYYRKASALRDELDMVQEENEIVLEKLRHAKEKRKEAEARAKELEKQVASLGEGVSLEAKLLSRKEAALRQKEAALRDAKQKKDGKDEEVVSLRSELQILKAEASTAMKRLQEAESETNSLRTMTQRMILTQDEMEEVALKRCWLARYWSLAVEHGICADIAPSRHEKWSALAPLPFELVISAAQKAKELAQDKDGCDKSKTDRFLSNLTGEGNIESMLSVEMGLRELASLKVEDAVMLAFSQQRTPSLVRQDSKERGELRFVDAYEPRKEEQEDVAFKQAWLIYFWGRAKLHSVETDIADERFQFWISRSEQSSTSHDAVDVERGLVELRKLGIEQQLWEACRRETNQFPSSSSPTSTLTYHHNLDTNQCNTKTQRLH